MSRNISSQIQVLVNRDLVRGSTTATIRKYGDNQVSIEVDGVLVVYPKKALVGEIDFIFDNYKS